LEAQHPGRRGGVGQAKIFRPANKQPEKKMVKGAGAANQQHNEGRKERGGRLRPKQRKLV